MIKEREHQLVVKRITERKQAAEEEVGRLEERIKNAEMHLRQSLTTSIPEWKQWHLWQILYALDLETTDLIADTGIQPPMQKSQDSTYLARMKRTIVCLCGSTRFMQAFQEANLRETLAGRIVLTIGCDMRSDSALGLDEQVKAELDALHKDKIDLADEILVLNVGGYVGRSTGSEILHAWKQGKHIRWLEEPMSLDELIKRLEA